MDILICGKQTHRLEGTYGVGELQYIFHIFKKTYNVLRIFTDLLPSYRKSCKEVLFIEESGVGFSSTGQWEGPL